MKIIMTNWKNEDSLLNKSNEEFQKVLNEITESDIKDIENRVDKMNQLEMENILSLSEDENYKYRKGSIYLYPYEVKINEVYIKLINEKMLNINSKDLIII